jgi:hypothetical protein
MGRQLLVGAFFMIINKTQRLQQHINNPQFLVNKQELDSSWPQLELPLSRLHAVVIISFQTQQEEELILKKMHYTTNLTGEMLGILDAYVTLAQNKPVEAVDRLTVKEIDFFLRDRPQESIFSHYAQELYDILSIGESLKRSLIGEKEILPLHQPDEFGTFSELSYSEQLELIENILGEYFYPIHPEWECILCEEIEDKTITFSSDKSVPIAIEHQLLKLLQFHTQMSDMDLRIHL